MPRPALLYSLVESKTVHAIQSEQMFTQTSGLSLLEAAEAAGLKPKHGCRAGLCRSCLCKKHSGTARNLLTGTEFKPAG